MIKVLGDTGSNAQAIEEGQDLLAEARVLAYEPLVAELLIMVGTWRSRSLLDLMAVELVEEGVWMALRVRRDDLAGEAAAQLVGMVGQDLHRTREGESWARLAEALLDRLGKGEERIRAWVLHNRAAVVTIDNPTLALRLLEQALELRKKVLPPDHPDFAINMFDQAVCLHNLGNDAGALEIHQKGQALLVQAYGLQTPPVAHGMSNQGEYLIALGRSSEALPILREALSRWERHLDADHPFLAYPLTAMGRALLKLGRPSEARPPLERAMRIREAREPLAKLRAETRFALARSVWAVGDRSRAVKLAEAAHKDDLSDPASKNGVEEIARWLTTHRDGAARSTR